MMDHHTTAGMARDRQVAMTASAEHARLVKQAKAARRAQRASTPSRHRRFLDAARGLRLSRPQPLPVITPATETPSL